MAQYRSKIDDDLEQAHIQVLKGLNSYVILFTVEIITLFDSKIIKYNINADKGLIFLNTANFLFWKFSIFRIQGPQNLLGHSKLQIMH